MHNPHLLTEKAAAEYIDSTPSTLQKRRHMSRPPAYVKIGRRVMYLKDDLDAFILSGRVDPTGSSTP